ncbi:MAG: hypothetical protein QM760_22665 [Nibricoccus sp.]
MGTGYYSSHRRQWSNGNYSNNTNVGNNTRRTISRLFPTAAIIAGYMTDDAAAPGDSKCTALQRRSTVRLSALSSGAAMWTCTASRPPAAA